MGLPTNKKVSHPLALFEYKNRYMFNQCINLNFLIKKQPDFKMPRITLIKYHLFKNTILSLIF